LGEENVIPYLLKHKRSREKWKTMDQIAMGRPSETRGMGKKIKAEKISQRSTKSEQKLQE